MKKKKILIIDDDKDILDALELTFESEGYTTKTLLDTNPLQKVIRTFKPQAIILDVLLNGADGRVICKRLKSSLSSKDIPIIMISAYPDPQKSVLNAGADEFVPKPFDIRELIKTVEKYI